MTKLTGVNFQGVQEDYETTLLNALKINQNLVNTAGVTTGINFEKIASEAYIKVVSGRTSPDQAIRTAIEELTKNGALKVKYPSGRQVNIASALSTNVRTASKHATMDVSLDICEELGATHVEVSWHADCAPDHQWMQGNVYKIGSDDYQKVIAALERPNCRHSISPFLKGFSKKTNHPNVSKSKITKQYELEQKENKKINSLRKIRLQQKADRLALDKQGTVSQYVNKTLTQVEKIIATKPKEQVVIFDATGKAILDLAGNETSVRIPAETMKLLERGNYRITHNHPDTGGSFSPADFKTAAATKSFEIRAVDDEWTYIAKPQTQWIDPNTIATTQDKNIKEAMATLRQKLAEMPKLTESQRTNLWRETLHEATKKTAQETGIIYIRKKRR